MCFTQIVILEQKVGGKAFAERKKYYDSCCCFFFSLEIGDVYALFCQLLQLIMSDIVCKIPPLFAFLCKCKFPKLAASSNPEKISRLFLVRVRFDTRV